MVAFFGSASVPENCNRFRRSAACARPFRRSVKRITAESAVMKSMAREMPGTIACRVLF